MIRRIVAIFLSACALALFSAACASAPQRSHYGVLLGIDPEGAAILTNFDTVVIDAQYFTKDEIAAVQVKGTDVYTYLNIGSIETFREGYDDLKRFSLAPYDNWPDEFWMDVSRTEWQSFIANEAAALAQKGVDGFFLDNADVYYLYPTQDVYNGLIAILQSLGQYDKPILMNGGDVFVTQAVLDARSPLEAITGVNQECVFTSINFELGTLGRQDSENFQYYENYLARCQSAGLDVYLTEYAATNSSIETEIKQYCDKNGFQYYLSHSINLDGK